MIILNFNKEGELMKLTVLVDNNTYIDQYYLAEPALSFLIEDEGKTVLFDTGYSDVFIRNAEKMNIDLNQIDYLVFSHGHNDHTGGVKHLFDINKDIEVICHSDCDVDKQYEGLDVGMPIKLNKFPKKFNVKKTDKEKWLTNNLLYLGQIDRTVQPLRMLENDHLYDDTALVYKGKDGLFVMTGCSHSGICNIIEQAKRLTGVNNIAGVIGGFHLLNNLEQTNEVCEYFKGNDIKDCWPCHCTDLSAKIALSKVSEVHEVGVSLTLNVE